MEQQTQPTEQAPVEQTPSFQPPQKTRMNPLYYLIPGSIILAGIIVAGALMLTKSNGSSVQTAVRPPQQYLEKNMKPIASTDHILGSASAPVTIVEYSDTECPYCKQYHPTLQTIFDTYGATGQVAWVYRPFPLYKGNPPLHSKAGKEAEAMECVAELGGNGKFWQYVANIFSVTPSNNGLDAGQLPVLAANIGINKTSFNQCLSSGKYTQQISDDYDNATAVGASGTPFTIIISKKTIDNSAVKMVQDFNNQYLAVYPTSPDLLYVSKDKHKVVMSGALPADFMNALVKELVTSNS